MKEECGTFVLDTFLGDMWYGTTGTFVIEMIDIGSNWQSCEMSNFFPRQKFEFKILPQIRVICD